MTQDIQIADAESDNGRVPGSNVRLFASSAETRLDPITFEVISHKFAQLTEELATTLQRTSGSVVVSEGGDFAVSLNDESGLVFAAGQSATMHSVALQHGVAWTLKNRSANPGIEDGDMFVLSDPWIGVVHQPDIALIAPIFVDGQILAWSTCAMHMIDTGGTLPGGLNPSAKDVFSEPSTIPPIKLVRGSVLQRDVEESFTRRSRLPELLALDLRAMIAANEVAIARTRELADTYTGAVVHRVIKQEMDNAETEVRARLRELPDGEWTDTQFCEVAGDGDRNVYAVRGTMVKSGDRLSFDVSDSDDQAGFFNSTWPATQGGLLAAILPLLCPDLTWAPGGVLRAIDYKYRPGTLISAEFPAAVSAGPISGGMVAATMATVLLAKMLTSAEPKLKENLLAVTSSCIPAQMFRGSSPGGENWLAVITELCIGGSGARSWRDGDHASGVTLSAKHLIPNVEHLEHDFPLLWLFRRELPDSFGAGEFRGGAALESGIISHGMDADGTVQMMVAANGVAMPSSRGLNGGLPAKSLSFRVHHGANVHDHFAAGQMPLTPDELGPDVKWLHPKTSSVSIGIGDAVVASGAGGGGYGDPLERDPALVAADVAEDYLATELAETIYGVVLAGEDPDLEATISRRAELRGKRVGRGPIAAPHRHSARDGLTMLSENVAVRRGGGTQCANCGAVLSETGQGFKEGAVETTGDLLALGVVWVDPKKFVDREIVLRHFSCPTCATLLETELVLDGDPVVDDRELLLPKGD